jgi:hypothetical protein
MGILQKLFDASATSFSKAEDKLGPDDTVLKHPLTGLKMIFTGVTCEATALSARIITKHELDTSKARFSLIF